METTLSGLHVLVTRPEPEGLRLSKQVDALAGKAIFFPTLVIRPCHDRQFESQILVLDQQDWLIFISPQSVYTSRGAIQAHFSSSQLQAFHVATVGAGTAKVLETTGFSNVIYPTDDWSSRGLMQLDVFRSIQGKKIALFRGRGGNDWLSSTLIERGAILTEIECYVRDLPQINVSIYLDSLRRKEIDIIVSTSGDGLVNLTTLLQSELALLLEVPIVVISARMVSMATELGFKKIQLANNASHDAIIESLLHDGG